MSNLDLKLLGGNFFYPEFAPEAKYLEKYFESDLGRIFAFYYLSFSELIALRNVKFFLDNFVDHTGCKCSEQRLRYLLKRLQCLLEEMKCAEMDWNLDYLENIKSGNYKFN